MNKQQGEKYLHYQGAMHYDTIGELISELKEVMFERHVKQVIYKKVLMVMIEALENIFKYNEFFEHEKEVFSNFIPEVKLTKYSEAFVFEASNPVNVKDISDLKKRLDEVNNLDAKGIKRKYKEIITNGEFSEKGGAGLGIIEMAKLSDSDIAFRFDDINSDFKNFTLRLEINTPS